MDSVSQGFRQGTAGMVCLCVVTSGPQSGRTKTQGLQQLELEKLLPSWCLYSHVWHLDGKNQRCRLSWDWTAGDPKGGLSAMTASGYLKFFHVAQCPCN